MNKAILLAGTCVVSAAFYLAPSLAYADDTQPAAPAATEPHDIVVSAQRRSERLQDVPASVSALSGESMAKQQISTIGDALAKVPNVQVALPYGEGGPPNFAIRGITSTDFSLNVSKPVAMNVDDSIRNLQIFEVQPLYDVKRIEVLRGPQGTLYGRNATGGAVNIITQDPEFKNTGYVTLGYGNFDTFKGQGAANLQLVPDTLAARVAVFYSSDDGIYKNYDPGYGNLMQTKLLNIRSSLRYRSGDFDATLRYTHTATNGRNNAPKPVNFSANGVQASAGDKSTGFYSNYTADVGWHSLRSDGFNLQMAWTPEHYTVQSTTSYDWGRMYDQADGTGNQNFFYGAASAAVARQFVQELRVLSSDSGPVNWLVGASHYQDDVTVSNVNSYSDLYSAAAFGVPFSYQESNAFHQVRIGEAIYAGLDYKPIDQLKLHGGVRHSWDRLRLLDYSGAEGADGTSFANVRGSQTFQNTSFDAGIDWKVRPHVLVYGSFKQAYRMGALYGQIYELTPGAAGPGSFAPPETTRAFELGVKSEFLDRKLTLNLSLSNTKYKNQQAALFTNVVELVSLPAAKINALEAEAVLRPISGFTLSGNIALTDAKYTQNSAQFPDIKGNWMAQASKVSGGVSAQADLLSIDPGKLSAHVDGNYRSKYYSSFVNEQSIAQHAYWLVDTGLTWDAKAYSVTAGVKNIFNKAYYTTGINLAAFGFGFDAVQRGIPRRYSVDITYHF